MARHTRTITLRAAGIALLCLSNALCSCTEPEPSGPPTLHLGRDECARCGMSILEDQFSCALLVLDKVGGHLSYQLFDDIGDMLDQERAHPDLVVKQRFVHDFNTRAWRTASESFFVHSDAIKTPMGSGIAAFLDERSAKVEAAKEAAGQSGPGSVFTYSQLGELRLKWKEERFSK